MTGSSLQRGDLVPHFQARAIDGAPFSYSTVWQQRNLLLVVLPSHEAPAERAYAEDLIARAAQFHERGTECVITRDALPGLAAPGVLVADKWGEIVHVASADRAADLPRPDDLLEWIDHVQTRCPECEGEAK